VVPVASGLIAGESLMAVLISALMAFGVAQKQARRSAAMAPSQPIFRGPMRQTA
jgi:hypothetical protein